jgi:hypothetical protein
MGHRGKLVPDPVNDAQSLRESPMGLEGCGSSTARHKSWLSRNRLGSSFGSETAFDAALASKDPTVVHAVFHKFYMLRERMEVEQEAVIRANVERVFRWLRLLSPGQSPTVDSYGFNTSIIKSYCAFLRQKHGLLGDLIRRNKSI